MFFSYYLLQCGFEVIRLAVAFDIKHELTGDYKKAWDTVFSKQNLEILSKFGRYTNIFKGDFTPLLSLGLNEKTGEYYFMASKKLEYNTFIYKVIIKDAEGEYLLSSIETIQI